MTNSEIINLLFSTSAVLVSIVVYFQSSRLNKRQIRIEKIEEMLEITHILKGNYVCFINVITLKDNMKTHGLGALYEENILVNRLKTLRQLTKEMDLQNKLVRLYILNNSYLPKTKLKDKIGILISLYASIADKTLSTSLEEYSRPFNQFPTALDFNDFTDEIQNELIEEMGLGYKNNIQLKNNPYEKLFKERYKL